MNFLRGIVAKVFVYTLFGLLIVSFAIWGIGDIFRGTSQTATVATVGEREIQEEEFRRTLAQEISLIQQQLGQRIEPEMLRAIGIPQQVLNRLVVRAMFAEQAEEMNLAVTENALRQAILSDPRFQDRIGTFDRNRFAAFLRSQGLSEPQYLERLRAEVVRDRVVAALSGGVTVPPTLAEAIYRYRNQQRIADYVELPRASLGEIETPDEETLRSFYQDTQDDYMAPEYRSVTYIPLRPQMLMAEMSVSDEALRQAYQERGEDLGTPATRTVSQIVFDSRETAQQAAERLQEGADFAAVARELTGQPPIDFGQVTRGQLPEGLAASAFELQAGDVSQPIETNFGWHVLRVSAAQEGSVPPFQEVRDRLREDLLMADAIDAAVSIANQLDDELAGGATLEEAAQTLNLPLESYESMTRQGMGPDGAPLEGLAQAQRFRQTAFATEAGDTSLLLETDRGGYFVLRVDGVTPPAPRPFGEVRGQVAEAWRAEERDRRLLERASQIAAKVNEGQTLEGVAADEGLEVRRTPPLTRDEADPAATPSAQLSRQLFGLQPGQPTIAAGPEGQIVAVLREVQEADPSGARERVAQIRRQLEAPLANDMLNLYGTALQQDYGVSVDQDAIERVLAGF